MKNYYAEFLQIKNINTLDDEVSKVSKDTRKDEKQAFDTFDTYLPSVNQKNFIAETLTEKLNAMFPSASAKVSIDDFYISGADKLTDAEKNFLRLNELPILCQLQQSLLVRHLFSQKPELREIFIGKIQERGGNLKAAGEITAKWFARLLDTMSDRKAK